MTKITLTLTTFYLIIHFTGLNAANNTETASFDAEQYISELINSALPPPGYNANIRPNFGRQPVHVTISLKISSLSSISETSMDFRADFSIRHYWNDHRLRFTERANISELSLEETFSRKIWLPGTFFRDAKEVLKVHKTVFSEDTTLLRLRSNGDILYSTKISVLASCSMNLKYFPVDQQKCGLNFGSFGKTTEEVVYAWRHLKPVEFNPDIELPAFRLIGYNLLKAESTFSTGSFSHLKLEFIISRHIDFYLTQVYVPAAMIVLISWIPFWLSRADSQARVALGVTTVLTMTTLTRTLNSGDLPKIAHLTALDVYLFFCFSQVFLSLIEYATVGYYDMKVEKRRKAGYESVKGEKEENEREEDRSIKRRQVLMIEDTSVIDWWARRLFPFSFALFAVVYVLVLYYINVQNEHAKVEFKL